MINFGLRGHDISNSGFEDTCMTAFETGITELQLALAKTSSDINFDKIGYDTEMSAYFKQTLEKYKLYVSVLGCYINPVDENPEMRSIQLTRFKSFISYAKDFDACVIGTETGMCRDFEQNYRILLNSLIPIAEYAEQQGVTVGIEPVWCHTISSPKKMKCLLNDIGSKSVGIIFDPVNLITGENYTYHTNIISEMLDTLADKIKVVHIKDFTIINNKPAPALAGCGMLDIHHLFSKINKCGISPHYILDELPLCEYKNACIRVNKAAEL